MYMYATRKQGLALALASIPAHLLLHVPGHYIQGAQMQTPFNMHCATHHSLRPHKPLLNHQCSHPSFLNNCTCAQFLNVVKAPTDSERHYDRDDLDPTIHHRQVQQSRQAGHGVSNLEILCCVLIFIGLTLIIFCQGSTLVTPKAPWMPCDSDSEHECGDTNHT